MEERIHRFSSLRAEYRQDRLVLGGPSQASVCLNCDGVDYALSIEQGGTRSITVETERAVDWNKFLRPLSILERLLMVFDGTFVLLDKVSYAGSPEGDDGMVESGQVKARRLSCFTTDKRFTIQDKLVDFQGVLNDALIAKWAGLLDELDIANQMYLYILADSGMPVDLRLAFLVELAEPMVEIVNEERGLFPSLRPGERGTSLKQCLNALINSYGDVIFDSELSSGGYDSMLTTLVNSRVRVMHIKTKMPDGKYFDGPHSVYYMRKMSLLYRVMLLELLGIERDEFRPKLVNRVSALEARRPS